MPPRLKSNFYSLLKLNRAATPEQIEQAFNDMSVEAKRTGENVEQIELLEEAFLTLSDPELRREHDAALDEIQEPHVELSNTTSTVPVELDASGPEATTSDHPCVLVDSKPPFISENLQPSSVEAVFESDHPFYSSDSVDSMGPDSSKASHDASPPLISKQEKSTSRTPSRKTRLSSRPPLKPASDSGLPRPLSTPPISSQRFNDMREISPSEIFTGAQLRRIREARGLTLQELGELTKVSFAHLENIEAERYSLLPPPVYLRGFLVLIAGALKLDPLRVTKDFLAQVADKSK